MRAAVARIAFWGLIAAGLAHAAPSPATAAQRRQPVVIENDRGGLLLERIRQIRMLVENPAPVEIRGEICHSTCTLFLSLPDVCVLPTTRFGFHGPSFGGAALAPDPFERASQVIAGFYPKDLRRWYLSVARHRSSGLAEKTGAELIAMGVTRCDL
jgi:hypothetical protein